MVFLPIASNQKSLIRYLTKFLLREKERITFCATALCGLLFLIGGIEYGVGSLEKPGSGLFPCFIGFIVFLLASVFAIFPIPKTTKTEEESLSKANFLKTILVVTNIAIYILLLNTGGFLVSTMILLLFLQKLLGRNDWLKPTLIAFLITILTWLLFNEWLGVELPKGFLNF